MEGSAGPTGIERPPMPAFARDCRQPKRNKTLVEQQEGVTALGVPTKRKSRQAELGE